MMERERTDEEGDDIPTVDYEPAPKIVADTFGSFAEQRDPDAPSDQDAEQGES